MGQHKKLFVERDERWPVSLRGFALNALHDSDIEVSELSYTGCRFDSGDKFKAGEVVELRLLKRGAIQAEVRWSADGRAGARFIEQA
jgi:PilZ domain